MSIASVSGQTQKELSIQMPDWLIPIAGDQGAYSIQPLGHYLPES